MAELIILVPLLALIVLGALDLGRVFSVWLTLSNATREGARCLASQPSANDLEIIGVTRDEAEVQGLVRTDVTVKVDAPDRHGGETVTVSAGYSMRLLTAYLFGGQPVAVTARTSMVILPGGG